MLLVNKLTFKASADQASELKRLNDRIDNLPKDSWTASQREDLTVRLTRFEEQIARLNEEVDFTRTSHKEFLRLLERAFIPEAHSPHTPRLDVFLERREKGEELTSVEWQELINRLHEQIRAPDLPPSKKLALRGLRAIYLYHLKDTQRKEGMGH